MFNQKSKKRSLEKLRLQSVSSDREKNPAEGSTQQRGAPFVSAAWLAADQRWEEKGASSAMRLLAWERFKNPSSREEAAASLWGSQIENLKQSWKK